MIFCLCNIVLQANDELLHTKYRLFTSVGRPTPSMFLVLTLAVPARVNHIPSNADDIAVAVLISGLVITFERSF